MESIEEQLLSGMSYKLSNQNLTGQNTCFWLVDTIYNILKPCVYIYIVNMDQSQRVFLEK